MTENTQKENLVLIGAKVKQPIREAIEDIAKAEDRSISYVIGKLLETHPQVSEKLEVAPVKIAA